MSCLEIPLPEELYRLAVRLQALPNIGQDIQLESILFVVRLVHAMHSCAYATFLTTSFAKELTTVLDIPELQVQLSVNGAQWTYDYGLISAQYTLSVDYDGRAMYETSRIALGVLHKSTSPREGLQLLNELEQGGTMFENHHEKDNKKQRRAWMERLESSYRTFPGRILVLPFLSSTTAACFFDGTAADMAVAFVAGLVAGLIHYICYLYPTLAAIQDLSVTFASSLIAAGAYRLFPSYICVSSIVLATMFWFYYGIALVLSLYEISNQLFVTGLTRLGMALVNTLVLAYGASLGIWIMGFHNGEDGMDTDLLLCEGLKSDLANAWKIVLHVPMGICALMQLRTSPQHWILCLTVQFVALATQYLLEEQLRQPVFVSSLGSSFMGTVAAHVCLSVASHCGNGAFKMSSLLPRPDSVPKHLNDIILDIPATTRNVSPSTSEAVSNVNAVGLTTRTRFVSTMDRQDNAFTTGKRQEQYQSADLWFCLLPALYLLVPGSKAFIVAFLSIIDSVQTTDLDPEDVHNNLLSESFYLDAVMVLGMGLVLGIKIAFCLLWLISKCQPRHCCDNDTQEQDALSVVKTISRSYSPTSSHGGIEVVEGETN